MLKSFESLGDLIRSHRKQRIMSIHKLAETIDVSPGYISKLELNRATNPSETIVYRLAKVFGLDPLELQELVEIGRKSEVTPTIEPPDPLNRRRISALRNETTIPSEALNLLTSIKNIPPPLKELYGRLVNDYIALGEQYCRFSEPNSPIAYVDGLNAYRAAEAVCVRAGLDLQAMRIRYRMARTYQNLILTDRAGALEQRIIYFYRALELFEAVLTDSSQIGSTLDFEDRLLIPRSLAAGATLYRMLGHEFKVESQNTVQNEPRGGGFINIKIETLNSLSVRGRTRANTLYRRLIDELVKDAASCQIEGDRDDLAVTLSRVLCLRAINLRGMRYHEKDGSQGSLNECIDLLEQAIEILRSLIGSKTMQNNTTCRQQLARYHLELAHTYGVSAHPDRYAQAMWQFNLSKEISPEIHDQYIPGDHYMREFMENYQNYPEEIALLSEQACLDINNLIKQKIGLLRAEGIIVNMKYPLRFTDL